MQNETDTDSKGKVEVEVWTDSDEDVPSEGRLCKVVDSEPRPWQGWTVPIRGASAVGSAIVEFSVVESAAVESAVVAIGTVAGSSWSVGALAK